MLRFFSFLCKSSIIILIWGGFCFVAIVFYYCQDLPSLDDIKIGTDEQIIEVLYSDGSKISTIGDFHDNQITFSQIPGHLIDAVVATEDRKFFIHQGVDFLGIIRAFFINLRSNKIVQGGSTITQQLAKLIFLSPERTLKRKIQELVLSWQLEQTFSKEHILILYLNRAYFGAGNYGVVEASKYYFNKPVSKINLNEAAMLAGLLKAPSRLSPNNNQELTKKRTHQVLINMIDAGYLQTDDVDQINRPIIYKNNNLQRLYFSDYAISQKSHYIPQEYELNKSPLRITTTMDKKLQKIIENQTNSFIKKYQTKLNNSQIAIVLMNKKGALLAMVGGKNYQKSQFNRAIHAKRQAGSAFKLFVYLTALQNGFTPQDTIEDKKVTLGNWSPENYNKRYYGQVSLQDAFAKSLNSVAVQLIARLDKKQIIKNALKMGVVSDINDNDATLALGTNQVSLLELVNSYGSIANDGFAIIPYSITKITNYKQKVLYQKYPNQLYQIIDKEDIIEIKTMLKEVVINGTGQNANVADNIYGKTGTSQNYRDAWFIGFKDDYILGVWMGNDDNTPTNKISGGTLPARLFGEIIKKITTNY